MDSSKKGNKNPPEKQKYVVYNRKNQKIIKLVVKHELQIHSEGQKPVLILQDNSSNEQVVVNKSSAKITKLPDKHQITSSTMHVQQGLELKKEKEPVISEKKTIKRKRESSEVAFLSSSSKKFSNIQGKSDSNSSGYRTQLFHSMREKSNQKEPVLLEKKGRKSKHKTSEVAFLTSPGIKFSNIQGKSDSNSSGYRTKLFSSMREKSNQKEPVMLEKKGSKSKHKTSEVAFLTSLGMKFSNIQGKSDSNSSGSRTQLFTSMREKSNQKEPVLLEKKRSKSKHKTSEVAFLTSAGKKFSNIQGKSDSNSTGYGTQLFSSMREKSNQKEPVMLEKKGSKSKHKTSEVASLTSLGKTFSNIQGKSDSNSSGYRNQLFSSMREKSNQKEPVMLEKKGSKSNIQRKSDSNSSGYRIQLFPSMREKSNQKEPVLLEKKGSKRKHKTLAEKKNSNIQGKSDSNSGGSGTQLFPSLKEKLKENSRAANVCCRFVNLIDDVLKSAEEDCLNRISEEFKSKEECILDQNVLKDLCLEAVNLKEKAVMHDVSLDKLVMLMNILVENIKQVEELPKTTDLSDMLANISKAADACLLLLIIMTSQNMPKRVYMEETIHQIISYIKFHSENTNHRPSLSGSMLQPKHRKSKTPTKQQSPKETCIDAKMNHLRIKLSNLIHLLADLLDFQTISDVPILDAASVAIHQFFTDDVKNLRLGCLRLSRVIFIHYEKHRRIMLEEILSSACDVNNISSTFELKSGESLNILTALILELIQSVIPSHQTILKRMISKSQKISKGDVICEEYNKVAASAGSFIVFFLNKCDIKSGEFDIKKMFSIFIQDILTVLCKPEWPVSKLLLNILGNIFMKNISNNMAPTRIISLGSLGMIAAKLLTESRETKSDEVKDVMENFEAKMSKLVGLSKIKNLDDDKKEIYFLQKILLNFLIANSRENESYNYAARFYIAQWYNESVDGGTDLAYTKHKKPEKQEKMTKTDTDKKGKKIVKDQKSKSKRKTKDNKEDEHYLLQVYESIPEVRSVMFNMETFPTDEYTCVEKIVKYLTQKSYDSQKFNHYLKAILITLKDPLIQIKTKALNSLDMIVEVNPSILEYNYVEVGLNYSFLDQSASVRESVVELVGKGLLKEPKLINVYMKTLSARLLDTSVSVRKRVIRVLRDICVEYPDLDMVPELLFRIARRISDEEETIQKLVIETYINIWFSVTSDELISKKVSLIITVISLAKCQCLDVFEDLFEKILKPDKDDHHRLKIESSLEASRQIIKYLVENILQTRGTDHKLPACLTILHLLTRAQPNLMRQYICHFEPFLTMQCRSIEDVEVVNFAIKILELTVPLIEQPNSSFLLQLEQRLMKLTLHYNRSIIATCLSCLSTVLGITKHFHLIQDCFKRYFAWLMQFKSWTDRGDLANWQNTRNQLYFRRALFMIGLLFHHFDFRDPLIIGDLSAQIADIVYQHLLYFLKKGVPEVQHITLKAIGYMCTKYHDYILNGDLKTSYLILLRSSNVPAKIKLEVLNNIGNYLVVEDDMITQRNKDWNKASCFESLKEMPAISSGISSIVMQFFLQEILDSYIHPDQQIRHSCARLIQMVITQGLMHPVKIIPYLICMSTDPRKEIKYLADKMLSQISMRNFIHSRALVGVELSFKLQRDISQNKVVRGFYVQDGNVPVSLNGQLYSLLRNVKQQRRALLLTLLKQFDGHFDSSLAFMLYLADNLAYFPYTVQDEPLFLAHHIDVMMSFSGTELMKSLKKLIFPKKSQRIKSIDQSNEESDNTTIDEEKLLECLPENTDIFGEHLKTLQGFILLLTLKQYLKNIYGFSDSRIQQYSASDESKIYEKNLVRRRKAQFVPNSTIKALSQESQAGLTDKEKRNILISQYLSFKKLMTHFDCEDSGKDEIEK